MVTSSSRIIYAEHAKLSEMRDLVALMPHEDQASFVIRVETLVKMAKQAESEAKTSMTQTRLREIIASWSSFLEAMANQQDRSLALLSSSNKASGIPLRRKPQPHSGEIARVPQIEMVTKLLRNPFSKKPRVDFDHATRTVPRSAKFRAIYDQALDTVDSTARVLGG